MNFMTNANNNDASTVQPVGSAPTVPSSTTPGGETGNNGQGVNYEQLYKELEGRMGAMGNELGEYRTFVGNITPLLEKLDANPDLVKAIVDGKIDEQLVKAVMEGKVSFQDAQAVTEANRVVAQTVDTQQMTPAQVEALVAKKTDEIRKEMEEKANLATFEQKTQAFIESSPDFMEYAEDIDKWLDSHPNIADVEVAYYAVKGQTSTASAQKAADDAAAERQRELVANAGGGGSYATTAPDGTKLIDSLVGGPANPLF